MEDPYSAVIQDVYIIAIANSVSAKINEKQHNFSRTFLTSDNHLQDV